MPVPDYSDPTTVRKQIAEDLRGQIRVGKYAPNGRLPSNKALAKHYGVAPETIRSALDELRAEKVVETRSTRGTFVTEVRPAGPPPDLKAVGERLAHLTERVEEYEDLRAEMGKLEADIRYIYDWLGIEYPHGGEHDGTQKAPRQGRSRR